MKAQFLTLLLATATVWSLRYDDVSQLELEDGSAAIMSREDPPQCPMEIASEHAGDPDKKWCCKNGAKMFSRKAMTIPAIGQTIWINNGCQFCEETEARFDVTNVEVHKFPPRTSAAATMDFIGTYADLSPKNPAKGPLYLSDGTFNPIHQYVLFLYTKEDHNGAFSFTKTLCQRLECWASRGYEVVMRRVASKAEAKQVLAKFHDDSIHHVVLSGHGSASVLQWGSGSDGYLEKGSSGTHKFLLKLREKIKIDGTVLLDACSNAEDRILDLQNLFEYVASKLPGRKVTASKVSLSDNMWTKVQDGEDPRAMAPDAEPELDEECKAGDSIQFVTGDGSDATAIRMAGRPNCKELTLEQITRFDSCLSRCRDKCDDVWKEDWLKDSRKDAPVTLESDAAAAEQIVAKDMNPCWFGKKSVCKIVKKG